MERLKVPKGLRGLVGLRGPKGLKAPKGLKCPTDPNVPKAPNVPKSRGCKAPKSQKPQKVQGTRPSPNAPRYKARRGLSGFLNYSGGIVDSFLIFFFEQLFLGESTMWSG